MLLREQTIVVSRMAVFSLRTRVSAARVSEFTADPTPSWVGTAVRSIRRLEKGLRALYPRPAANPGS